MEQQRKEKENGNKLSTKICSIAITVTLIVILVVVLIVIVVLLSTTVATTTEQYNKNLRSSKRSVEPGTDSNDTNQDASKHHLSLNDIETLQNLLKSPSGELLKTLLLSADNETIVDTKSSSYENVKENFTQETVEDNGSNLTEWVRNITGETVENLLNSKESFSLTIETSNDNDKYDKNAPSSPKALLDKNVNTLKSNAYTNTDSKEYDTGTVKIEENDSNVESIKSIKDDPLQAMFENITKDISELLIRESEKNESIKRSKPEYENEQIYQDMVSRLNSSNIRDNAFYYAEYPHEPGSRRSENMGREMAKKWKEEYGLDKVEIFEYNVLLSLPERPAEIHLRENDQVKKTIKIINEPDFGSTKKSNDAVYPFNAYSRSGNVTGEVVYCNYGRDEDYDLLVKLKVKLGGKIHIIRYGLPNSRGSMMSRAMEHRASAVIFYSDPQDFVYPGQEYPTGWMLNEYGVQRGNIGNTASYSGDLLSEGYPSKDNYFREKVNNIKQYQYKIPSQPLSASKAKELINFMDDYSIPFPDRFQGGVNSTYALQTSTNKTITLSIDNKFEDKTTLVVCGTLFGVTEPDRYIMIGNHRDAWTYGAADPVSGSSVMSELVRVLGQYRKSDKFRPRRSIMACSWGAEEVGMLGSIEWAEENTQFISQKVIAYINIDMAVEGNYTMQIKSLDHMARSIFDAAKQIKSPDNSSMTLFQEICKKQAILKNLTKDLEQPDYSPIGTESDSMIFVQRYGIGVSDYRYIYNGLEYPMLETHNGQYHTLYDNFDWMSRFVDPTFKYHLTLGKLWLMHTLILADSAIIPLDIKTYCEQLQKNFFELEKKYASLFRQYNISTQYARERIANLVFQVTRFAKIMNSVNLDKLSFVQVRAINDIIMNFGHQFMLRRNAGDRTLKQVYATFMRFPGIVNAVTKDPGEKYDNVHREITNVMWCVDLAASSLDLSELGLDETFDINI